jgi:hypothetical protein
VRHEIVFSLIIGGSCSVFIWDFRFETLTYF